MQPKYEKKNPTTSLKKLLSSLLFYLRSISLKTSDIPDKSERTIVTDGEVIYMQVLIQHYRTPRHVKPLKHRCG